MTPGDDKTADPLPALVEAAGLADLWPRYEQSLRAAVEQARRHAESLEGALELSSEPAHIFKPNPDASRR